MSTFQHPSLRPLRHHLSLLNAQFAFQSNNTKYARALLRRLIASFMTSDPPSVVYIAHLALITHMTSASPANCTTNSATPSAPELQAALSAITTLSTLAAQNRHSAIEDLAAVFRVRILVGAGLWDLVGDALSAAEKALQLVFPTEEKPVKGQEGEPAKPDAMATLMRSYSITAQDVHSSESSQSQSQTVGDPAITSSPAKEPPSTPSPKAMDSLTLALTAHLLILGVTFHTHGGRARAADARLAALHALMDGGALVGGADSDGLVEVRLVSVALLTFADFTTRSPFRDTIPFFYRRPIRTFYFYSPFLSLLLQNEIQCLVVPRNESLQSVVWCSVGKVVWVKKGLPQSTVSLNRFLILRATQLFVSTHTQFPCGHLMVM